MRHAFSALGLAGLLAVMAGCGPVRIEPKQQLPPPLIDKLPATIALHYPAEFAGYVHKETRNQVDYEISLGPPHVIKLRRLLEAMFARVVEVDDPTQALAADPSVLMVLEPRFEDYSFLTPRDMAGESFTVTIRYRLNVFNPQGERVDGYVFTGYGREKSSMVSNSEPLVVATQRAMRDAGAKIAVELTSQDTVRRLLAGNEVRPQRSAEEEKEQALGSFGTPAPEPTAPATEPAPSAPEPPLPPTEPAPPSG
jgi:hypothetical protein